MRTSLRLAARVQIFPDPGQEDALWHLSDRCRLLYNFALHERKEEWLKGRVIRFADQSRALPIIKKRYPEYRWVYSKVLQAALRNLDADFRSFLALRRRGRSDANPPRFKGRQHFFTMQFNQSGFRIGCGRIALSHFFNSVPLSFSIPQLEYGMVKQVSVSECGGDYFLSIIREAQEKPYRDNGLYQAIDLGVTKAATAVNMQGKFFEAVNPRPDRHWNPIIDALQSRRDRCREGSRRWLRFHLAMRKCQRKLSNQIRDFQHKLSRQIVDNTKANTLIIGDLDVKSMAKSKQATKGLNRSTQNTGYLARFAGFLAYKCRLKGKRVIGISEADTSRTCCACGKPHRMPLSRRTMECDCGNSIDRDRNSAVNIMVRFLSHNAMWTGYLQFVGNLRKAGLNIGRSAGCPA